MEITIRPGEGRDLAAVVEVECAADAVFATVGLAVVLGLPSATAADHTPAQSAGRLLVACNDDEGVLGFVRVEVVDGQAHVEQVSVHPTMAGHGIGAQLMAAAERWASAHGFERMTLCTYRDVPWNGPYYRRLGWTPLSDDELGPELRALRRHERDIGLEVQPRQAMVKVLAVAR